MEILFLLLVYVTTIACVLIAALRAKVVHSLCRDLWRVPDIAADLPSYSRAAWHPRYWLIWTREGWLRWLGLRWLKRPDTRERQLDSCRLALDIWGATGHSGDLAQRLASRPEFQAMGLALDDAGHARLIWSRRTAWQGVPDHQAAGCRLFGYPLLNPDSLAGNLKVYQRLAEAVDILEAEAAFESRRRKA